MRLAVFTNQFPVRGDTFFSRDMAALLRAGIDVDIFPFYPRDDDHWQYIPNIFEGGAFPRDRVHHISQVAALRTLRPVAGRKLRRFIRDTAAIAASAGRFGARPLLKSAYVFPKAWAWSSKQGERFDHVLAYWGNYAATCAYLFHRQVERVDAPFSLLLHAGMDLYEDQVFLREKLLYADNIIVVCDFNREYLRDLYPDIYEDIAPKIVKHHLGLDLARYAYVPGRRPSRSIIAVGRLEKEKGFEYLLRALHELARRGVDCDLELVGDGSQAGELRRLASELEIDDRVHFAGWLHADDVQRAMERATVLVHPSVGLGDAVPTVIKEAMAVGTPVVASAVAGIPELLDGGRCGVLLRPGEPLGLADAVEGLLRDPDRREAYSRCGRNYAEEHFELYRNGTELARLLSSTSRSPGERPRGEPVATSTGGDR